MSSVSVHSSCRVMCVRNAKLYACLSRTCVCICRVRHLPHTNGIYTLCLIPTKTSQLFHPSLFSANKHMNACTHTRSHTRQLHHTLWNSLLPWRWNRARSLASPVLFCCFLSPSPALCRNALLPTRGFVFSHKQQLLGAWLFFTDRSLFSCSKCVCLGDSSAREHPVASAFLSCPVI